MKKLLILFLTLVMSVSAFGLIACGEDKKESQSHTHGFINGQCSCGEYEPTFRTEGLLFSLINNGTEYEICGYVGGSTEVIIPDTYNGKPVTSIGDGAFVSCSSLTSIVIPNSVEAIGYGAFEHCDSLQYNIEGNLKYLGNNENPYLYLADTTSTDITSATINANCRFIGAGAFSHCYNLTSIVIPNSVTSIGNSAFYNCDSLTSIVIPNSVANIGYSAFLDCSSLTSIVIPNSVETIGNNAFLYCYSLQYNIEGNLKYLGNSKNPYLYLAGTTSYDITSATINANCKIIGYRAFYNCESLTSIVIPNSVEAIGDGAFYSCDSLTINCEANSKPSGWHQYWNSDNRPVVWGYKG